MQLEAGHNDVTPIKYKSIQFHFHNFVMMNSFSVRTRSGIGRRQRFIESIPPLPPTTSLASRTSISISFFFFRSYNFRFIYILCIACVRFSSLITR